MTIDFDADLEMMLAEDDFGVAIVFGEQSTSGHEDVGTEGQLAGPLEGSGVNVTMRSVLIRTSSLTGLEIGSDLTVNGTARRVRDLHLEGLDGLTTRLWLEDPD